MRGDGRLLWSGEGPVALYSDAGPPVCSPAIGRAVRLGGMPLGLSPSAMARTSSAAARGPILRNSGGGGCKVRKRMRGPAEPTKATIFSPP